MTDRIEYSSERAISTDQFIDVLKRSTLGDRRPIEAAGFSVIEQNP